MLGSDVHPAIAAAAANATHANLLILRPRPSVALWKTGMIKLQLWRILALFGTVTVRLAVMAGQRAAQVLPSGQTVASLKM
jgi:hypothetical protein